MSVENNELPDDATHEQIVEFIDKTVMETGENADDQAVEKTSDDDAKTPAGDDDAADDDSAAPERDGDDLDEKDGDGPNAWLDDDLKSQVSTLGISDEQLAEFGSREELDRAMRLLDAAAMKAGRQAAAPKGDDTAKDEKTVQPSEQSARDTDGRFKPKTPQRQPGDETGYKVQLNPEEVGAEEVVREFNNLRDHYEARLEVTAERLASLEQAMQQREARAEEERFDSIVDTLELPELFGESGRETEKQLANRKTLFEDHKAYLIGLKALGRDGKTDKAFLARVCNMTFRDHVTKNIQKQLTRKISRQSNMRMGGSVTKPTDHKYNGPPERDPELLSLYAELERESGG
jgi:hypothetical protein